MVKASSQLDSYARKELIRSLWEFAAISQFLHFFSDFIGKKEFDTELLEEALVNSHEQAQTLLVDVHTRLLVKYYRNNFISEKNYQDYLRAFCYEHDTVLQDSQPFALPEGCDGSGEQDHLEYCQIPLKRKVLLLHCLCEAQWEFPEKFASTLQESLATQWRLNPVGYDASGREYWLLDDHRLYQDQSFARKKQKTPLLADRKTERYDSLEACINAIDAEDHRLSLTSTWKVICSNVIDWENFPGNFAKSRNANERELYKFLNDVAAPVAVDHFKAKEHELALKLALQNRKRSSRLVLLESEKSAKDNAEKLEREKRMSAEREKKRKEAERRALQEEQDRKNARHRRLLEREMRLEAERLERERRLERRKLGTPKPAATSAVDDEVDVVSDASKDGKKSPAQASKASKASIASTALSKPEKWEFKCECGVQGLNYDDGLPTLKCDRCEVWAHIKCSIGTKLQDASPAEREKRLRRKWWCVCCREVRKVERAERKKLRKVMAAADSGEDCHSEPNALSSLPSVESVTSNAGATGHGLPLISSLKNNFGEAHRPSVECSASHLSKGLVDLNEGSDAGLLANSMASYHTLPGGYAAQHSSHEAGRINTPFNAPQQLFPLPSFAALSHPSLPGTYSFPTQSVAHKVQLHPTGASFVDSRPGDRSAAHGGIHPPSSGVPACTLVNPYLSDASSYLAHPGQFARMSIPNFNPIGVHGAQPSFAGRTSDGRPESQQSRP